MYFARVAVERDTRTTGGAVNRPAGKLTLTVPPAPLTEIAIVPVASRAAAATALAAAVSACVAALIAAVALVAELVSDSFAAS